MAGSHLEQLSAELIRSILLELPTTGSIYSLIRASPKCYQVFLASKERILFSVISQTIAPAAFVDALAAVQASKIKDMRPDRKAVLDFLRRYENKRHKTVEQKVQRYPQGTAVSLCQLYRSTQYFITRLTMRSIFYLRRSRDTVFGPIPTLPWSDVEKVRLQRAFYRYELYTQIFSSDMKYNGEKLWQLPSDSHFFLEKYHQWEVEELACVASSLSSLLSGSFDRIEPNFVGTQLPRPPFDDSETVDERTHRRAISLREAKYEIHRLYLNYLLSLSLPFLHHALRLNRRSMQQEMSSHIHYDGRKHSLWDGLVGFSMPKSQQVRNVLYNYSLALSHDSDFQFNDTTDGPNEGWLHVYTSTEPILGWSIEDTTRSLGYVFWDSQRLRDHRFKGPLLEMQARYRIHGNRWPIQLYLRGAIVCKDLEDEE